MISTNQAAWLDGKGKQLRVGPAEMPKAGEGEIVIRNRAIAINPVSHKIQDLGLVAQVWPTILDMDVAGEVHEVGPGVDRFRKGDRVVALADGPAMSPDTRRATFQLYTVVKVATAAKIPENKSFSEACVLPIAFNTALVALCGPSGKGFGLPFPTLDSKPSENTLIIWGASSAVGLWSLQLARAAGVKAVAVASEHNHTLCKSVGAAAVVDYRKPSVIEGIVQAVKTIGGDFVGIFDCVSDPETSFKSCMRVMEQLGGGTYGNIQPHIDPKVPDNVKATTILGISEMTHAFWQGFIAPALEHGRLRCLPEALVAGEGLESLQKGLNMLRKGVSAKKVVVTLN